MTTIAYKDGILAADTRITWGNIYGLSRKIHIIDHQVFGIAGSTEMEEKILAFYRGELKKQPSLLKKFEIIKLDLETKKASWAQNNLYYSPIEMEFYSIGSGWQCAMTAMHMGLKASDAVKAASELDVYTNSIVDTYNIKTRKLISTPFPKKQ